MSTSGDFDLELNNLSGNTSFWELKQYGRCIRRLENGNKLCSDICNMIQDRVDIEKSYSSSLHKWSSKWAVYLENGSEYGSTKSSWLAWCTEAEALSDLHKEIRNKMIEEVQTDVRNWQKEHYHKSALPPQHLKEGKSLESDFDIAQKPWAKKFKKMIQSKRDYHQQCKIIRSYEVHNKNALNDSSISQEQLKKMEEKLKKAEKDTEKLKSNYESSLRNLEEDSSRYKEEMIKVFNKSQAMENERMEFFKLIFFRIQSILNLSESKSLQDIYCNYNKIIENLDPDLDIKQWSQLHGADMCFTCPQFEEYTQDLHSITKKKFNPSNDSGVTLTAINTNSHQTSVRSIDTNCRSVVTSSVGTEPSTPSPNIDVISPISLSRPESILEETTPPRKPCRLNSVDKPLSCKDPNDLKVNQEYVVSSEDDGRLVKALYDYNGIEEDELSLKQGEIFLKLEDEDEQGWCKGKKNGNIGLYPANYAEDV